MQHKWNIKSTSPMHRLPNKMLQHLLKPYKKKPLLSICVFFCEIHHCTFVIWHTKHAMRTLLWRAKVMRIYLRPSPLRTSSHPLHLCMPTVGLSLTRRPSLSMQASEPPPLPAQLNANIHQSPLHSPRFHHPLLCAYACRTVGLIRPLLFTRFKQTTQQFGCRTTAAPDQMSVHYFSLSLSLSKRWDGRRWKVHQILMCCLSIQHEAAAYMHVYI